jgi:ankyrin repeat protein
MPRSLAELLIEASLLGDSRRVAALLKKGASPNAVDSSGTTAVYAAALHADSTVVRLLLEAGADPNIESTTTARERRSALRLAGDATTS